MVLMNIQMLNSIDSFLNKITMYRSVLYFLILLLLIAMGFSFIGWLPYSPIAILFSALFITTLCVILNVIFAWGFSAPANVESVYITALILALIIDPITSTGDITFFTLAIWASVWAMASKYIFAIGKKHIFNPAAIAVAITALTINQSASWWVGTLVMAPFVLIGGLMIVRKIIRKDLVYSFFLVATAVTIYAGYSSFTGAFSDVWRLYSSTPIMFFAFVMLTEPLTTPPTRPLRVIYGAIVGFFFLPSIHIDSVYLTPELALVLGNIFSYLASPKEKLILTLKQKKFVAAGTYDFIFTPDKSMKFRPGQYLEWTIPEDGSDSRGNRRYFTIASSPTESTLNMGVKFYPKPSSFKKGLINMKVGDKMAASQLAGDFTLPKNPKKKLVFIAGGIGVTPFRSMIKYLVDRREKRDIVVFYSNKTAEDVAYKEVFDSAVEFLGIKVVYVLSDVAPGDYGLNVKVGRLDANMIAKEIPDFKDRDFYISGPHGMVSAFEETLENLGVSRRKITTDFFPGFA